MWDKVYKGLLPGWSEQCGLEFLTPSVTRYSILNASPMINFGFFVRKAVPHKHTRPDIIENWLVYHKSKFFSVLRSFFLGFGTYELEKAVLNLSIVTEQEFNIGMQMSEACQSKVNSLCRTWKSSCPGHTDSPRKRSLCHHWWSMLLLCKSLGTNSV